MASRRPQLHSPVSAVLLRRISTTAVASRTAHDRRSPTLLSGGVALAPFNGLRKMCSPALFKIIIVYVGVNRYQRRELEQPRGSMLYTLAARVLPYRERFTRQHEQEFDSTAIRRLPATADRLWPQRPVSPLASKPRVEFSDQPKPTQGLYNQIVAWSCISAFLA